jgi:hypothetical protein
MVDENAHGACVDAWMERATKGLPPERLVHAFEQAFGALWQRAHQTLGPVTLTAIVDRVLSTSAERFPFLAGLEITATGVDCRALRERAGSLHDHQLADGIRFVLVEYLTVLGNLTAEVLTPALHEKLSNLAPEDPGPDESHREPGSSASDGEDIAS